MKKIILETTVLVGALVVGVVGCSSGVYNDDPLTVEVPGGVSGEVVGKVMIKTVANRGWMLQSYARNEVIATLKHRGYDASVTLRSDGSVIRILSEGTFTTRETGESPAETQLVVPVGWLENLQKDLRTFLAAALYQ